MDYCHSCRRHLNGALACAGCGTPAEACRGDEAVVLPWDEPEPYDEVEEYRPEPLPRGSRRRDRRERPTRASRRAAHRRRRRRVLLVSAGLVLAAGGLSLTELGIEAPFSEPTAASPDGSDPTPDASPSTTESILLTDATDRSARTSSPTPSRASASPSSSPSTYKRPNAPDSAGTSSPPPPPQSTPPPKRPAPPQPTSPPPPPEPAPSDTCDAFLFWCT